MRIKKIVFIKFPFKSLLLFIFFLPSTSLFSQTDSLAFITINFNIGNSFYTPPDDGIPNSYLSNPLFNTSASIDIGFRLNRRTQLFFGQHISGRSYRVMNSNAGTYGFISKDISKSISSKRISLNWMIYNKKNTKLFYFNGLGYSRVNTDIKYVYNDSIPVNNYTTRNRQSTKQEPSIFASLGFGIEHRLFLKEIYLMSQLEYIVSNKFGSATSINRLNLSAGISLKFY